MDTYYDLGTYSFPVTTSSPQAQLWFDRGLLWTFGFNHEEAIVCFHRALEHDPDCAMAHWGIAYAAGPNYNLPWRLMDDHMKAGALSLAWPALQSALALADRTGPVEQALIRALSSRYQSETPVENMSPWDDAFADAMRAEHAAMPDQLEIACILAEAMMTRTPWLMWDLPSGDPMPGADTLECMALLERAMGLPGGADHPGLTHLYVHLMEMSPTPEKALKAADVLRRRVPDAGHLVHMPTHIDMLCGNYADVLFWNERAIEADLKYYDREGGVKFYTGYRQHNYHFAIYGAMFLGQIEPALRAVRGLAETTPAEALKIQSPPYADFWEAYLAMEPHVLIRFGRWNDILQMELPEDPATYATLNATLLYAKGLAHAALGQVPEALEMEQNFLAAHVPETRRIHNNTVTDVLAVAREMLRGEILYREEQYEEAYAALRRSVALEDALNYDEPWGWMQPTRHALGALLYEQGRVAEAEEVYRQDLGLVAGLPRACVHPDNVWALKGLHDCLAARGETVEIAQVRQRLDFALARADTEVAASCFCAQAAMASCCG
ncbi:hypothetical protein [Pseudooceanicola sp.]|uniref:hypothetical protein n=1 Tax=Pseudooceanicola sp. TaxID=1914328 RepID=UPI0035C6C06E